MPTAVLPNYQPRTRGTTGFAPKTALRGQRHGPRWFLVSSLAYGLGCTKPQLLAARSCSCMLLREERRTRARESGEAAPLARVPALTDFLFRWPCSSAVQVLKCRTELPDLPGPGSAAARLLRGRWCTGAMLFAMPLIFPRVEHLAIALRGSYQSYRPTSPGPKRCTL
jgi:hypothetical protein